MCNNMIYMCLHVTIPEINFFYRLELIPKNDYTQSVLLVGLSHDGSTVLLKPSV